MAAPALELWPAGGSAVDPRKRTSHTPPITGPQTFNHLEIGEGSATRGVTPDGVSATDEFPFGFLPRGESAYPVEPGEPLRRQPPIAPTKAERIVQDQAYGEG